MTEKDHSLLYEELKIVMYTRGHSTQGLTEAQEVFVTALEQASFGANLLKVYAELIDLTPDIKIRNLHAFCLGFALGLSGNVSDLTTNTTSH